MKTILVLSILLATIALPTFAELTDADLDKIRLIVKDEVKSEIGASETRMKSYVDAKIDSLKTPVTWLIGLLVAIIAIIGLPLAILTIFLGWRSVKDNSQEKINQELREENRNAEATADCPSLTNTAFAKAHTHTTIKENYYVCHDRGQ